MTLPDRLKSLRQDLQISQVAMGAQGFVSTPGWVKIEQGKRVPSDDLLHRLISWLIRDKHISVKDAGALREQLLVLKYLGSRSQFVRKLAYHYGRQMFAQEGILISEDPAVYRVKPRQEPSANKTSRAAKRLKRTTPQSEPSS